MLSTVMVPKSKNTESLIISPGSNFEPSSALAGCKVTGSATRPIATSVLVTRRLIRLRSFMDYGIVTAMAAEVPMCVLEE